MLVVVEYFIKVCPGGLTMYVQKVRFELF